MAYLSTPSAAGTTDYITVTGTRSWEIQYPSGTMYSVSRNGNTLIVTIYANTSTDSRNDYFNVKTTDGSKTVKISLSQGSSTSSYNNNSNYHTNKSNSHSYNYRGNALSRFNVNNGNFEMFWWGIRPMMGTAAGLETSVFAMRWSWFGLEPIGGGAKYDFISDDLRGYYQPDIKFYIPWDEEAAVTLALGPSFQFGYYSSFWFMTEIGIHWHYGNATSSNFFLRYNGALTLGVSVQFSTGW